MVLYLYFAGREMLLLDARGAIRTWNPECVHPRRRWGPYPTSQWKLYRWGR